ncbi:efflux RND transporter periplasmic adaptor subunit [Plesiomonas shigelloides subsp. oncorhynchi]|nr:efflux RND transporter periplasmic adaptor subunit [Plesiomonas shigelloides]
MLLLLWLTGCDGDKTAAESGAAPAPMPVKTLRLQGQEVPEDFSFVGLTKSSQQVNIVSRVNGFLDKQVYQDGAMVKQGQTLFLVDAKPFQAQLQAAQAALSQQKPICLSPSKTYGVLSHLLRKMRQAKRIWIRR